MSLKRKRPNIFNKAQATGDTRPLTDWESCWGQWVLWTGYLRVVVRVLGRQPLSLSSFQEVVVGRD